MKHERRAMYLVRPEDRGYGTGWCFTVPTDRAAAEDYIQIWQYAAQPAATPDGWMGLWWGGANRAVVQSRRNVDLPELIAWARATGVDKIYVEDEMTRMLRRLPPSI